MSIRHSFTAALATLILIGTTTGCHKKNSSTESETALVEYVDMKIGTGGHGHVFMGANVPFGMVQLGPSSIPESWDWTSGYHESDSTVIGFPHTHLSGTGIGDLHDITLMPVVGTVTYARGTEDHPESGLWSYADRSKEVATPGYYATHLSRYDIDVELTATNRVGLHRYHFARTDSAAVVIDLENGGCWDDPTQAYVSLTSPTSIEGYRFSKGWASNQKVYFVAEFSEPITSLDVIADGVQSADKGQGQVVYARANMDLSPEKPLMVKVALSSVSIEGARANMAEELPGFERSFEEVARAASNAWEEALSKIRIESQDEQTKRIFYTALYHTMIAPSTFSDVNGDYYGADHERHNAAGTTYTTLSLWDTYRAAHPLMTLIHPEKMADMMRTFLNIYHQQGKLPVWHLMGCETNTMVGNPGIPVVADAILKGYLTGEEAEEAFEAMDASAMLDERGMGLRKKYGYIPYNMMLESVAYDLEYALADWAVAQAAKKLGKEERYTYYLERSLSYQHLFDPTTRFMRGKDNHGVFNPSFDPYRSDHRNDDYCEGNAWQYTFLVPHDLPGLVDCFGSKEAFMSKLDSLFSVSSNLSGEETSPDISGLIGQYAHGNEPSHHIIYFYTMLGEPKKSADLVRQVLTTLYHDAPDGLSGNEDVGQMSAWYILSALGFYQVEPAGGRYFFGSPIIDKAVLQVRDGHFTIEVEGNSATNKYIQKVELNGVEMTKPWLDFEEIAQGGTLKIRMGAKPTLWYKPAVE